MRKFATLLAGAAALLFIIPAPSTALLGSGAPAATASAAAPIEIGHVPECTEAVPAAVAVPGEAVTLDTTVLLDGVSSTRAAHVMDVAAGSYAPLGITVRVTFESVSLGTDGAQEIIDAAKAHFGGTRPAGSDVVLVLTDKDIQVGGNTAVAGLADCIGGVAFDDRAFAVSEVNSPDEGFPLFAGLVLDWEIGAKIAAHEIGHLMGAHHHYANCVEGVVSELDAGDVSPCTLMFNAANFSSLNFSTLNGVVVAGHAQAYAAP